MEGGVVPLDNISPKYGYCIKINSVNGPNNENMVLCFDT